MVNAKAKAKQDKRQRDIKSKLMAAIAMLLVSSIMMVSSTYAWFTLSTAPEVTGITTAVGANGNLEIALLPTDGQTTSITSGTGDSMNVQAVNKANVTWGNLVDLSNNTLYGMDKLTLYPSALNAVSSDANGNLTKFNTVSILETPSYGTDGRVTQLVSNTSTSTFDTNKKAFLGNTEYGVRAIGVASGMTTEQVAYRSARAAASTAMVLAQTLAGQSLNDNGSALASIAVIRAAGSDGTYDRSHLDAMEGIVDDLTKDGGVLDQLDTAYLQYLYALCISGKVDTEGTIYSTATTKLDEALTKEDPLTYFVDAITAYVTLDSSITTALDALEATKTTVATAETQLNTLITASNNGKESFTWSEISGVLTQLADPTAMLVNGYTINQIKEDMSLLVSSMGGGIKVTMASGGGVYADVADHAGDYSAFVALQGVTFSGITLDGTQVTMNTKTAVSPVYLTALSTMVSASGAPSSGSSDLPLSDFYGYIIDLAFRTNAANSNLQLQADAVDRIYSGTSGVENETLGTTTMGNGSSMTFAVTDASLGAKAVVELMDNIRIVFFNPADGTVYANAALDTSTIDQTTNSTSYTAKMYIFEYATEISYNASAYKATVAASTVDEVTTYTPTIVDADGNTVTDQNAANLYVMQGTGEDATYVALSSVEEEITTAVTLYTQTTGAVTKQPVDNNTITALTQNQAQKVSVLVYLDGTNITNASVAAGAKTSLSGTMNLQFSSSATLVPMEYADLKGQTISSDTTTTTYNVTVPTGVTGNATVASGADYTFTVDTTGYTLGTVTVGGNTVTPTDNGGGSYTIPAASVTGDIVITATAN